MPKSITQRATRTLLDILAAEARACQVCAAHLPLGPKPVFLVGAGARLMIVGQAPGRRVHQSLTFGDLGMDAYAFGPKAEALVDGLAAA